MTYEFEYLLHLFSCGARGGIPDAPSTAPDMTSLLSLAREQSVLPMVSLTLAQAPDTGLDPKQKQALAEGAQRAALLCYQQKRALFSLLSDFESQSIRAVLLKGHAAAQLYAVPECRVSVDTDIYVDPADEKRALRLLKEKGCRVTPRQAQSHHASCVHPVIGLVELHTRLYDDLTSKVWFSPGEGRELVREPYERRETPEGAFYTLGRTDQAIFLALHMAKHFIHGGLSLRQMMDVALHMQKNHESIDVGRFWDVMEKLRFFKLLSAVFSTMVDLCGFEENDFPGMQKQDPETVAALLNDLESGGWLGISQNKERKSAYFLYSRAAYARQRKALPFDLYMLWRFFSFNAHSVFPKRAELEAEYPHAQKTAWLLPAAWLHHVSLRFLRKFTGSVRAGLTRRVEHMDGISKDRVKLFKEFHMMD